MFTANLVFSTHYEPFFFHPGTCATEIALAVESNKKINDLIEEIFATELANTFPGVNLSDVFGPATNAKGWSEEATNIVEASVGGKDKLVQHILQFKEQTSLGK